VTGPKAVYLEHRGVVKLLGVISALGSLAFLGVIGLFVLEGMSMRALVAEEAQTGMAMASGGAWFNHLCGLIGTGLMAMAARAELKRMGRGKGSHGDMVFSAGGKKPFTKGRCREFVSAVRWACRSCFCSAVSEGARKFPIMIVVPRVRVTLAWNNSFMGP